MDRNDGVSGLVTWLLRWHDHYDVLTDERTGMLEGELVARNLGDAPVHLNKADLRRVGRDGDRLASRTVISLDYRSATVVPPGGSAVAQVMWSCWNGHDLGAAFEIECGGSVGTATVTGSKHPIQVGDVDEFTSGWFMSGSHYRSAADAFEVDPNETPDQEHAAVVGAVGDVDAVLRRVLYLLEHRRHSEAKMAVSNALYNRDRLGFVLRRYRRRAHNVPPTTGTPTT